MIVISIIFWEAILTPISVSASQCVCSQSQYQVLYDMNQFPL